MPRQRTEFGLCPRCGERVSVAVKETDYAWLIGDRYESVCAHCAAPLVWKFKDVGDWSAWAPISRASAGSGSVPGLIPRHNPVESAVV
jgi:hypothetical protein